MAKLKRIGILSFALFETVLMAIIGLIIGLFIAIISSIMGSTLRASGVNSGVAGGGWLMGLGFLAIIIAPIMYAIIGFIFGIILAFLTNVALKMIGGIEFEFEQ